MNLRTALLRTLLAVGIFIACIYYMSVLVPRDGQIDLRESLITVLSILFALLILIHAWWNLVWNKIMLHREKRRLAKQAASEQAAQNQYREKAAAKANGKNAKGGKRRNKKKQGAK